MWDSEIIGTLSLLLSHSLPLSEGGTAHFLTGHFVGDPQGTSAKGQSDRVQKQSLLVLHDSQMSFVKARGLVYRAWMGTNGVTLLGWVSAVWHGEVFHARSLTGFLNGDLPIIPIESC